MNKKKIKEFIFGNAIDRERMLRFWIVSLAGIGLIYERHVLLSCPSVPSVESMMFILLAIMVGVYVLYCDFVNTGLVKKLREKNDSIQDLNKEIQRLNKVSKKVFKK